MLIFKQLYQSSHFTDTIAQDTLFYVHSIFEHSRLPVKIIVSIRFTSAAMQNVSAAAAVANRKQAAD
jgi:hypothetical protein